MEKTNQPGMLANVNKNILKVAPEYQRQASPSLIKSIKEKWSWSAAGVLIVSKRDNQHYVIDGQHRLLAAKQIPEINNLPCLIFELSIPEEARALVAINSHRKSMTSIDKFVGQLKGGNELANYVNARVEAYKFRVAKSGSNSVKCVNSLMKCAQKNKQRFERVLSMTTSLFKYKQIQHHVFIGLELLDSKINLNDARFSQRILDIGADALMASVKSAMIRFDNQAPTTCARGIMEAVNKNLRNKFEVEL